MHHDDEAELTDSLDLGCDSTDSVSRQVLRGYRRAFMHATADRTAHLLRLNAHIYFITTLHTHTHVCVHMFIPFIFISYIQIHTCIMYMHTHVYLHELCIEDSKIFFIFFLRLLL